MIIPDTNLLVYAYNSASRQHVQAKNWLEDLVNRQVSILLPWIVALSFLRLMTHRSVLKTPMDPKSCFELIAHLYSLENVKQIDLGAGGRLILAEMIQAVEPVGNLFYDAYIAALAREYRAVVHSNDADFARFPGIELVNPLLNQ